MHFGRGAVVRILGAVPAGISPWSLHLLSSSISALNFCTVLKTLVDAAPTLNVITVLSSLSLFKLYPEQKLCLIRVRIPKPTAKPHSLEHGISISGDGHNISKFYHEPPYHSTTIASNQQATASPSTTNHATPHHLSPPPHPRSLGFRNRHTLHQARKLRIHSPQAHHCSADHPRLWACCLHGLRRTRDVWVQEEWGWDEVSQRGANGIYDGSADQEYGGFDGGGEEESDGECDGWGKGGEDVKELSVSGWVMRE